MVKATFTVEQSWASELSMLGYQLKPSDRSKLNWFIKEHRGMVEKLNVILKDFKEHDSRLFQSNGLALKQGVKFVHSLNIKQILPGRTWKHQNIRREVMAAYSRTAHKPHINNKEERKPQKAK